MVTDPACLVRHSNYGKQVHTSVLLRSSWLMTLCARQARGQETLLIPERTNEEFEWTALLSFSTQQIRNHVSATK